jgi:putative intracellular protease/amidase/quinol monooxygenase YgiN
VSPEGGKAPVDGVDLDDPVNRSFWENPSTRSKVETTLRPNEVRPENYAAIFFAGGHGTMWDLPGHATLAQLTSRIYEQGGVVAAVCHGLAGLADVKLSDGQWLVAGKEIAAFTNDEERAVGLEHIVPFLVADRLVERGARHRSAPPFTENVVISDRLVTGQNPQSALGVGNAMAQLLAARPQNEQPPRIAAPAGALPVVLTIQLRARDAAAFKAHLLRVIPVTRRASGCRYSHTAQSPTSPRDFVLVQSWDSLEQQQGYMGWRQQRGDLAELLSKLEREAVVEAWTVFDT